MNYILFKKITKISNFCFIIFLIINQSNNYIILPFKSTHLDLNFKLNKLDSAEYLLSEINKNQIYTTVSIGNPPKIIEFYFTMDNMIYTILSGFCPNESLSNYNPFVSQNYKNSTDFVISVGPVNNAAIVEDNCSLYNNINLTQTKYFENFEFLLGNYTYSDKGNKISDKFCGIIGLYKSSNNAYAYARNFIKYLKKEKIIDSYSWGIIFFDKDKSYNIADNIHSKYEGFYIVGITNKDYLNIFKTNNIISVNSIENNINFKIFFYDISNNMTENVCSDNSLVHFVVDYNYILSEKEYFEKIKKIFFQKYIDNKICESKISFKSYEGITQMIVCDSIIKEYLNSFPSIYFYNKELSFTFYLDYNDLFLESNNKIFFLIAYKAMIKPVWILGKIFMKKYPLIFDQDKNTISFIYLNKFIKSENYGKKSFYTKIKTFILYSLLFIGIIIGIFIGRRIWNKHRKLKAYELEENFEYVSQNKNTKIIE